MKQRLIAIFMSCLIIILPVYSANVFATNIVSASAKGVDGIEGIVKRDDSYVDFEAVINTLDSDLANNVVLGATGNYFTCQGSETGVNNYKCEYRYTPYGYFIPKTYTYTINVYSDDAPPPEDPADSEDVYIVVDNLAPVVESFSINPETTSTGEIVLAYQIQDYAYAGGGPLKCSGIGKAEFYESGTLIGDLTKTYDVPFCNVDDSLSYTHAGAGDITLCIKAYDRIGKESQMECSEFTIDKEGPAIRGDTLTITHPDGYEITHYKGAVDAKLTIDIATAGLDKDSVKADLSELTGSSEDAAKTGSCSDLPDGVTECYWNFVLNLVPEESAQSKIVKVSASDNIGNEEEISRTVSFEYDDMGPEIISLTTGLTDSYGNILSGRVATFTANIREEGAGVDKDDMILHYGLTASIADECSKTTNWECTWENVDLVRTTGTVTVYIGTGSKDRLGNNVQTAYEIDVVVDDTKPIVSEIGINPIGSETPESIKTGDSLEITAKLTEDSEITEAVADFSAVIAGSTSVEADGISKVSGYWYAKWITDPINVPGYISDKLHFDFTNIVGKTTTYYEDITVLEEEYELQDYWESKLGEPSPAAIDKELVGLYQPFIWYPVELRSREGKPASDRWPANVKISSCTGDTNYLDGNPELINHNPAEPSDLPYTIYLKYKMNQQAPADVNNVNINCSLMITTLIDSKKISQEETDDFSISIEYYNNPLGTIDSSIEQEIERVKYVAGHGIFKIVGSLQKLLNTAQLVCRIFYFIEKFKYITAAVKDGFSTCCAFDPTFTCCAGAIKAGLETEGAKEAYREIYKKSANKFCKLLSCRLWESDWGDGSKIMNTYMEWSYQTEVGSRQRYWGNVDPQHSLILSAVSLCLPGVIYNLQKARVIECSYLNCLKQTKTGRPLYLCTYERSYGYCKFVYGELFNLIPFASAISRLTQNIKKALSHPLEAVGFVANIYCKSCCLTPIPSRWCLAEGLCTGCTILEYLDVGFDVLCDLGIGCESFSDRVKAIDDDVCKDALSEEEE